MFLVMIDFIHAKKYKEKRSIDMRRNIVAGYRTMIGMNQSKMADVFGITRQTYALKEKGEIAFSDEEKVVFTELVQEVMPNAGVEDIFFTRNTKKRKEKQKGD